MNAGWHLCRRYFCFGPPPAARQQCLRNFSHVEFELPSWHRVSLDGRSSSVTARLYHDSPILFKGSSNGQNSRSKRNEKEAGMAVDFDAMMSGAESEVQQPLAVSRIKGRSDYWKLSKYLSVLDKHENRSVLPIRNGLIGISFEALKRTIADIVRDCGVAESDAFNIALCLRANKPPDHLKETINVLMRQSISLDKILKEQWETFAAIAIIPPEQVLLCSGCISHQ